MTNNIITVNTTGVGKKGKVFRKDLGRYYVSTDDDEGMVVCSISSTLRKRLIYPAADPASRRPTVDRVEAIRMVDPVAIGDRVAFIDSGDGSGMITAVLPRRNTLSRRAAGKKRLEQVIATNVDQVVAVLAVRQPKLKLTLLDRYLVDAEWAGLPSVICITKMDLDPDERIREDIREYERIGYGVFLTSALSGKGLEELKGSLEGRVSVLVGKSGVGKTALLNAIQPGLGLKVNEVNRATGKGKHTTSRLEMFTLDFGGGVIDTPGMREFGLWDVEGGNLAEYFPEMRPYLGLCRFGLGCSHTHEPGCAIKEAVEAGEIPENRYRSFVRMTG